MQDRVSPRWFHEVQKLAEEIFLQRIKTISAQQEAWRFHAAKVSIPFML